MYIYCRKNGEVVLRSEEKQHLPQFIERKIEPTGDERTKIDANMKMKFVDERLQFTELEKKGPPIKELIERTEKAKTVDDLKQIILTYFLEK